MTPEILQWLNSITPHLLPSAGRVLEVGAQNINGTPRAIVQPLASEYIGTDMTAGEGVDRVVNNADLSKTFNWQSFDTIICCECLEHDVAFWNTVEQIHQLLKPGGKLIITTPTFLWPLHRYPCDFWRFGEDAYRQVLFKGFDILNLSFLDSPVHGKAVTIAEIGRKL